ncbi:MAG TPA: TRAM domain-containing protein, partial [Ktedonobacterales bacterium]|nr:TRAM domain-containing protein [Ktedonobacterales bacterium]
EEMAVKIIQDGKELGQGVGYLDDGTMIVVEGGKQYIGTALEVTVTRVLQTIAGRMIFAQPKQSQGVGPASAGRRAEA